MPFVKGQSGNPDGGARIMRPIRQMARNVSEEAIQVLIAVMRSGEKSTERASAAKTLLQLAGARFSEDMAVEPAAPILTHDATIEELEAAAAQGDA